MGGEVGGVGGGEGFVEGFGEVFFGGLEVDDFLFDGIAGEEAEDGDGFGLADAVGAVGGLGFGGGVPPWVEMDDDVGGGEVEAVSAGFE